MNNSDRTDEAAPFSERLPEFIVVAAISSLAVFGNVSLWLIILRDRQLRTVSNWMVLCLSAADLFVSTVNMPFIMVNLWMGGWVLSHWACVVLGFFSMSAFISSVVSLASISWNRYLFICHPNRFKSIYTKGKTLAMIAGIWLLSGLLAMPPLLGWGRFNYIPSQSICFCEWKTSVSYTFFMVGICFGGPCIVMAFCYVKILLEVRASKRRLQHSKLKKTDRPVTGESASASACHGRSASSVGQRQNDEATGKSIKTTITAVGPSAAADDEGSTTETFPPSDDCKDKNRLYPPAAKPRPCGSMVSVAEASSVDGSGSRNLTLPVRQLRMDRKRMEAIKLTTTFLAVVLTFIIMWMPFCVTMFISVFSDKPVPRPPNMATIILGCFNSCCNPIIYGVMNKKFRDGYAKLYCSLCSRYRRSNGKVDPLVMEATKSAI